MVLSIKNSLLNILILSLTTQTLLVNASFWDVMSNIKTKANLVIGVVDGYWSDYFEMSPSVTS
jgi:hypothetical protein